MEHRNAAPGNPLGMCQKLFCRSLTFGLQQREEALLARIGSKDEAAATAGQENEIVITDVEKVAISAPTIPGPVARHNSRESSQVTKKTAPARISSAKDNDYKFEDYINRTRNKFKE